MATDTAAKPRTTRRPSSESSAKRSAVAKSEARDADGRFESGSPASDSAKPAAPRKPATARKPVAARAKPSQHSTGAILGAAAAGLAVGLAANVARKLAIQAPTALAGEWDDALAAEHKAALKIFDALEATLPTSKMKRGTLLMQLKHALAKHAMQEENVIYPAMRDAGEVDAADQLNKDHGYVKQYLYELGELPKDDPAFIATVYRFRADIEKHMREEEQSLFPRIKGRLTAEKNKELTSLMNREGLKLA